MSCLHDDDGADCRSRLDLLDELLLLHNPGFEDSDFYSTRSTNTCTRVSKPLEKKSLKTVHAVLGVALCDDFHKLDQLDVRYSEIDGEYNDGHPTVSTGSHLPLKEKILRGSCDDKSFIGDQKLNLSPRPCLFQEDSCSSTAASSTQSSQNLEIDEPV